MLVEEIIDDIRLPTWICLLALFGSALFYRRLAPHERLILVILLLNGSADIIGRMVSRMYEQNGIVYNVITPLEKAITFGIYLLNTRSKRGKMLNAAGMALTLAISIAGFVILDPMPFHSEVYIGSAFILAVGSYYHLREMATDKAMASGTLFAFALANLVYYTLMVSSVSALPLALEISNSFASQIFMGNDLAYSLWSIIIFIGIAWNKTRT
jgi:hypothetical protein